MNRVVRLPELLLHIFSYLDGSSLPCCALVCKGWSECALDLIWRELDCPKPLFSLLAPFTETDDSPPTFRKPIEADAWKVFDRYAGRVKSLGTVLGNDHESATALSDRVYSEISMKRPRITLLPNLRRLWVVPDKPEDLTYSFLFINENVRELALGCPEPNEEAIILVPIFLDHCTPRVPNLKTFEVCVYANESISHFEDAVVKFLSSMTNLEEFSYSVYYASPKIFAALSQLRSLDRITFQRSDGTGVGCADDALTFSPTFSPGSFPMLTHLSLALTFEVATSLFACDFACQLGTLVIHSPELQSAARLHSLLIQLSKSRRRLVSLTLSSAVPSSDEILKDRDGLETDLVTLDTLTPLLDFPCLVEFGVTYHRPLKLDNSEVLKLLRCWSHLEVLFLCSDPQFDEKPSSTPAVLPIIAECCPKLRTLSLYIDTHMGAPPFLSHDSTQVRPFSSLRRIEFGRSPLEEQDILGICLFLSDLLTEMCDVDDLSRVGWFVLDAVDTEYIERWDRASMMLKGIIAGRVREQMRTQRSQ